MTWMLDRIRETAARVLDAPLPSVAEQFGQSISNLYQRNDSWGREWQHRVDLVMEMEAAFGGRDRVRPSTPAEVRYATDMRTRPDFLLGRAENLMRMAPEVWGTLPRTREEFEREVRRRRQEEFDETQELLARGDSPVAQMAGSFVGAMTDEFSVATLPLGGPLGSGLKGLVRYAAIEGAIAGLAELPTALKEQRVADELGFEAQGVVERVATGVALGGVLGLGLGGVARGLEYLSTRTRGEAGVLGGAAGAEAADAAEDALRRGGEPPPPSEWEQIRNGIFAGESGGDYDALFGFSNRPGGPFENVRITQMTVDEAIAFSDPSGPYGQWVKGQIGRVATPMGGFQIVGTTLRAVKEGMGLRGDEIMTPDLQDRMGQYILRTQGTGAWEGYRGPRSTFDPPARDAAYAGPPGTAIAPGARRRTATLPDEVTTPAGRRIRVQYRVVDLSDLKAATGDLQPRDRSRAASDDQITAIAARLDPARLMPAPETDRGTPLVGPDGVIESGNGRVRALALAAETNPEAYRGYVDAIRAQGFEVPDGMARPVLVAERTSALSEADRVAVVRESNMSAIARLSATEQARFDAGFLTAQAFEAYQPGARLAGPENAEFLRRFLGGMTAEERAPFVDAAGLPSPEGLRRLQAALVARAFDAQDILRLAAESDSRPVAALVRMLEDIAPDWAAFRTLVEDGLVRPEFDITGPLTEALRIIVKARVADRDGQSVIAAIRDRVAQGDLFQARDPLAEALIDVFYRGDKARNPDASGDILRRYAAAAAEAGRADTPDLFAEAVGPADVLARAVAGQEGASPYAPLPPRARLAEPDAPADIGAIDPAPLTDGTASPAVQAADAALEAELRADVAGDTGPRDRLTKLAAADPSYSAALEAMRRVTPTDRVEGYGSDAFWQQRRYKQRSGEEIVGKAAAVDHLAGEARTLAWREDGLPPEPVLAERRAVILIGPPAAGKSTVANPLARALRAAIVDADEAKKIIPEYGRGEGVSAVHEESSVLARGMLKEILLRGENLLLPKVGSSTKSILDTIDALRAGGYSVNLIEVVTDPDEAIARMIGRGRATGRYIPPGIMADGIEGAPRTYRDIKERGLADAYARIDNNPGLGEPRGVIEDADGILAAVAGRNGGDRGAAYAGTGGGTARREAARPDLSPADPAVAATRARLSPDAEIRLGDAEGIVARQLRTSNEQAAGRAGAAGVSSRIPDTTGRTEDSAAAGAAQPRDGITEALAEARTRLSPDAEIRLGEGEVARTVTARQMLDDIQAEAALEDVAEACRIARARA